MFAPFGAMELEKEEHRRPVLKMDVAVPQGWARILLLTSAVPWMRAQGKGTEEPLILIPLVARILPGAHTRRNPCGT